jgi:hypothetical protein
MERVGDVTHTGKIKNNSKLTRAGSLRDLDVHKKIITKWAIEKYDEIVRTSSFSFGYGPVVGCCEHGAKLVQSTDFLTK